MSIVINENKKTISLFNNFKDKEKQNIYIDDLFLENKIISSLYLISLFLKDKEIFLIQIKNDFIEIDFITDEKIKLKDLKKISWKEKLKTTNLKNLYEKKFTINFFDSSKLLKDFNIEIKNNTFNFKFFDELFLQNLSTYKLDDKVINRLQFKISSSDNLLDGDHRKINKKVNFFCFDPLIGPALPVWLGNGELVKKLIKNYVRKLEEENNFLFVTTPVIVNKKLYEISGHFKHYKDSMFPLIGDGINSFVLRPMTCPQHCLVFNHNKRSYKELPLRISENSLLFRYETSGSLTGLERVRQMELKDLHVFIQKDEQIIKNEIEKLYKMTIKMLDVLGIKIDKIYLSLHDKNDKDKYFDDQNLWKETETILQKILNDMNVEFQTMKGEAAFYGPKIDFQIKSALGHDITISTIQLDFLLPRKFKLKYRTKSQEKDLRYETPIILHHGIFGTYERLISILLEQNNGWLPFWLSVNQVAILPVTSNFEVNLYCKRINQLLEKYGIRSKLFEFNNNLSLNIKEVWNQKIPYKIVIGEKELKEKEFIVSHYKELNKKNKTNIFDFIEHCKIKLMHEK